MPKIPNKLLGVAWLFGIIICFQRKIGKNSGKNLGISVNFDCIFQVKGKSVCCPNGGTISEKTFDSKSTLLPGSPQRYLNLTSNNYLNKLIKLTLKKSAIS